MGEEGGLLAIREEALRKAGLLGKLVEDMTPMELKYFQRIMKAAEAVGKLSTDLKPSEERGRVFVRPEDARN